MLFVILISLHFIIDFTQLICPLQLKKLNN